MTEHKMQIIDYSLTKAMSYPEYLDFLKDLVKNKKSSAPEHNEELAEFSKLNLNRTQRWHKKLDYPTEDFPAISNYDKPLTWLLITESWCGDAAHSVPVIAELAKLNKHIDLKVVLRDQNTELIDQFLTNGGRSIPKLVMFDHESQDVIATWGPRPEEAAKLYADYKRDQTDFKNDLKTTLQKWYNKDKGKQTSTEIEEVVKDF